jgi:hypothetical protein
MLAASLQPLWEGIVKHQWTEGQLAELPNAKRELEALILSVRAALGRITAAQAMQPPAQTTGTTAGGQAR